MKREREVDCEEYENAERDVRGRVGHVCACMHFVLTSTCGTEIHFPFHSNFTSIIRSHETLLFLADPSSRTTLRQRMKTLENQDCGVIL